MTFILLDCFVCLVHKNSLSPCHVRWGPLAERTSQNVKLLWRARRTNRVCFCGKTNDEPSEDGALKKTGFGPTTVCTFLKSWKLFLLFGFLGFFVRLFLAICHQSLFGGKTWSEWGYSQSSLVYWVWIFVFFCMILLCLVKWCFPRCTQGITLYTTCILSHLSKRQTI